MEERVEFTMSDVIPEELLAGLSDTDREMESINRPSISYWRNCWIRLKKDKLAMLGLSLIHISLDPGFRWGFRPCWIRCGLMKS